MVNPNSSKRISKMKVGETGYTVPWAIHVDADGEYWVNTNQFVSATKRRTMHILIIKEDEGFSLDRHTFESADNFEPMLVDKRNLEPVVWFVLY